MRKTRAKISWEGGDVAPFPRSGASLGDIKMNRTTAGVPIENCLIRGVQSDIRGTIGEQLVPNKAAFVRKSDSYPL